MLERWKKKRRLKLFLSVLPSLLAKRYGTSEHYTKGQVKQTLKDEKLGETYSGYALTLFLSQEDGVEVMGNSNIYNSIRQELADWFFEGNIDFKVPMKKVSKFGDSGHDSSSGDASTGGGGEGGGGE